MKSSRSAQSQLFTGPLELQGSEHPDATFRTSEQGAEALGKAEHDAAIILDEAIEEAGLCNKEVAALCGVSQSLVEKWRSTEQRGAPSLVQIILMGPRVHLELHRAMNRRSGFGRQLLARAFDDLFGAIALTSESR